MLPRPIVAALCLFVSSACADRETSRRPAPDTTDTSERADAFRAIGTEPFWGLAIDSMGLRFTTPEDLMGIRWPPLTPMARGDTVHWIGETERAAVDARIWPARCSDGMSDRVWPYLAVVRIDGTTYRGCAESRAGTQAADVLEGNWQVVAHRAPGIAAMSAREAETWVGSRSPKSFESRPPASASGPRFRWSRSGVPVRGMCRATGSS